MIKTGDLQELLDIIYSFIHLNDCLYFYYEIYELKVDWSYKL